MKVDWELIGILVLAMLGGASLLCGMISVILTVKAAGAW